MGTLVPFSGRISQGDDDQAARAALTPTGQARVVLGRIVDDLQVIATTNPEALGSVAELLRFLRGDSLT